MAIDLSHGRPILYRLSLTIKTAENLNYINFSSFLLTIVTNFIENNFEESNSGVSSKNGRYL